MIQGPDERYYTGTMFGGNIHTLKKPNVPGAMGVRGDTIPSAAAYSVIIAVNDSMYDGAGNVLYTNQTGSSIQPGTVNRLVDAGNGQFMFEVDTTQGPTPLNIGTAFTKAVTPDPTKDGDAYAYFNPGQGEGNKGDGTAAKTTDGGGDGGHGGLGWLSSPGIGPFNKGETSLLTIALVGTAVYLIAKD
jgi:hypothetical protein